MVLLKGQKIADRILNGLKKEGKNRRVKLAVVWVGNDKSSRIYIGKKKEVAQKIGAGFELYHFPEKINQKQLEKEIKKITGYKENSGVIVQLPLPEKINTAKILNLIPAQKDVDVLSEANFAKFSLGKFSIVPPTVAAVSIIMKEYKISLKGKYIVVVGAGRLVGKPLAAWLARQKANFSILDKSTEDLPYFTKKADILITGVGKANLIRGDMVKEKAVVIDVGGDINFNSVSKKAKFITPVIGGVGPLTVAYLLENLVKIKE